MEKAADVIVVGGGPVGSFVAWKLAKTGAKVIVFEEHDEVGVPSHCAGHVSIKGLRNLGLWPLPSEIVENTFHGAIFHSPNGNEFSVRFPSPKTCVVNRALFDKYIARQAEDAGTIYCLGSRAESLIVQDGAAGGVIVKPGRKAESLQCKLVVSAEGISSRLPRQAGLNGPNRRWLITSAEAEVDNVRDVEPSTVEVFLGKEYAPGFFAWLIPKCDRKAKIGLGTRSGNPKMLLQKLMRQHPIAAKKLSSAETTRVVFHSITLGGPIPKTHSDGFMVVGDAASHVKSTTGGGVVVGLTCGRVAAEVGLEALGKDDFSSEFLSTYQKRCGEIMNFDAKVMLRLRRALDALSDRRLDDLIGLCARLRLSEAFRDGDIDFQGKTLLHLLKNPRMLTILGYFLVASCTANP